MKKEQTKTEEQTQICADDEIQLLPLPFGAAAKLDDETLEGVRRLAKDLCFSLERRIVHLTDSALAVLEPCKEGKEKGVAIAFYYRELQALSEMMQQLLMERMYSHADGTAPLSDVYEGKGWLI